MAHHDFVAPPLDARVFPPGHRSPTPADRYNLVVIGAGTAGLVAAAGAAGLGARVALVERRALGGDCLNVGCVPSKTLLRAAGVAATMRDGARYGVHAGEIRVDFAAVMQRVRDVRYRISAHDSVERFTGLGVDVFLGDARFVDRSHVAVAGATLAFARAVVATGGRPTLPPIDGLAEAGPLTNDTVFEITAQPPRLAIIGGGPIGCELAQAFARLGTRVTLLEAQPQLLGRESADAATLVRAALERDGVDVRTGVRIASVRRESAGVHLALDEAGRIEVDEVLVAAGRTPNVESLDLASAGIDANRRGVIVNDYLQTSNDDVYAAGDVCLAEQFTHAADASARIVVQNALFLGRKRLSRVTIPRCTYTDPEVAHVGETPDGETAEMGDLQTYEVRWAEVDRAITDGDEHGSVRIYARDGKVVGGTVIGHGAGDLIGEVAVLAAQAVSLGTLAGIIHPYPTRAEAIRKTGDLHNKQRLTPTVASLFGRWLAWRR